MELTEFNSSISTTRVSGKATIRLTLKSGVIAFSKKAIEIIGLDQHKGVILFQDNNFKQEWYVAVSENENAFRFRKKDRDKDYLCFSCIQLCSIFLKSLGLKETGGFVISNTPVKHNGEIYYPIITSNRINAK